jgi:leucine dehydrogenase
MSARILDYMRRYDYRKLVMCNDASSGLRAIIAIHSTSLGPATGGLRMWPYPSEEEAIFDALRLARGMTYKYAAAGVNLGGGKAVIIGDPKRDKSEALLRALGRFVDQLGGEYITGEDVGTTLADMEVIFSETNHVVTLPKHCGGAGDIAPATALGSVAATKACAKRVWGTDELKGRKIALQAVSERSQVRAWKKAEQNLEVGVMQGQTAGESEQRNKGSSFMPPSQSWSVCKGPERSQTKPRKPK